MLMLVLGLAYQVLGLGFGLEALVLVFVLRSYKTAGATYYTHFCHEKIELQLPENCRKLSTK